MPRAQISAAIAEDGRHAGERHAQEHDRQSRQRALDGPPSPFRSVDRRPQREQQEPGIGRGLHHEENDVLRQKRAGPKLEPGPELERLAGVELDHIDEEAPGHEAGPRPHQPGRAEHDQDSGNRVEHDDEVEQAIGGPRLGCELDFLQRVFWRRRDEERRLAPGGDVGDAAPLRQQTGAAHWCRRARSASRRDRADLPRAGLHAKQANRRSLSNGPWTS